MADENFRKMSVAGVFKPADEGPRKIRIADAGDIRR